MLDARRNSKKLKKEQIYGPNVTAMAHRKKQRNLSYFIVKFHEYNLDILFLF